MPSALDLRIDQVTSVLTAEGGPAALSVYRQHGVDLPMVSTAPPNLALYFEHFCAAHGDKEFLVCGDERLSFATVYAAACDVAGALVEGWGVQKGDRVGIAMRNAPSWIVIYMGVLMAGGCATLINGWWQGKELAEGIDDVGASLVFADLQRAQRLSEFGYKGGATIVTLDIAQDLEAAIAPIRAKGGGADTTLPDITGDDLATILFTSGSTGQSKGAYCNQRAVVQGTFNYITQAMMMLQLATQDGLVGPNPPQPCALLTVPLFHVTGEVPVLLVSFALGRKLIMMPKWDVVQAMQLIEKEKVTNFTGVPLMSFELISHPDRHKYDLSTLQGLAGGGAPRPIEHVKRITDELPSAPPALGYGLTETNGVGCGNFSTNYQEKPNSTGRASAPLVDLAILDDDGKPMPQGERGEVSIRSVCNFSGYWNRPDASADCMTVDGYFRTGDVGYLDPDGYLFIVDRKKDIIIRGGENISCQEVEAALYEYPGVAEACVFGLPDERLGEVVGAVIHFHVGQGASADEVLSDTRERIASFKVPHRLWIESDPLPRLGTEKLDKVGLRKRFQAEWLQATAA
jgi:long-chain acyl-CoA synthetase